MSMFEKIKKMLFDKWEKTSILVKTIYWVLIVIFTFILCCGVGVFIGYILGSGEIAGVLFFVGFFVAILIYDSCCPDWYGWDYDSEGSIYMRYY